MERKWWKEAVVYQIYPRSFYDSNCDGIGDLMGIAKKISYLKSLGVNVLWICPFYQSPMKDNGYDVSDYYAIDPQYGTMEDMDYLIQRAKAENIKVILDLVLNHTSDQHLWFKQACADKNSKYRDYYIFKDSIDNAADLRNVFGGSTWTQIADGSWYFHTFAEEQPDLNWDNPELRQEIYKMINWWIDKGISGFRMDAITYIKKNFDTIESQSDGRIDVSKCCLNQPGIDELLQELKEQTYGRDEFFIVAEAPGVSEGDLERYIGENGHFSAIFDFSYTDIDIFPGGAWSDQRNWSIEEFKQKLFKNQYAVQKIGWAANYLENHDQPRSINKYFSKDQLLSYHEKMAKALGTLFFFLKGTPFIYQGEELGIGNTIFRDISEVDDVNSVGQYARCISEGCSHEAAMEAINRRSRDHARLPMQWNNEQYYGFSKEKPWIACNQVYTDISVEQETKQADSVLNYYKRMIHLRQRSEYSDILIYGDIAEVDTSNENVICYRRFTGNKEIYVAVNMGEQSCSLNLEANEILLGNYEMGNRKMIQNIRAYEAIVWI